MYRKELFAKLQVEPEFGRTSQSSRLPWRSDERDSPMISNVLFANKRTFVAILEILKKALMPWIGCSSVLFVIKSRDPMNRPTRGVRRLHWAWLNQLTVNRLLWSKLSNSIVLSSVRSVHLVHLPFFDEKLSEKLSVAATCFYCFKTHLHGSVSFTQFCCWFSSSACAPDPDYRRAFHPFVL